MSKVQAILLACATTLLVVTAAHAADQLLSGAITSQSGQKLEGVTVSAKLEGSTITTERLYGHRGQLFFPPLPAGKYRVWAQALGFETNKGSVDLTAARRQNFTLQEITDPERRFRQLPGEMMVAALPEATAEDARMKKIFMNNCTGCHSTGYALQFRFDEAGWNKIINLMKVVPNNGVYPGPTAKPNQIMDRNQKQLAAYLARARGPGESSMKVASRPRPTGEAARAVWTLYDLPLNPGCGHRHQIQPERRHRLVARHHLETRPDAARRRHGSRRHDLLHRQQPQPQRDDRQGRSQDGRGQVPEGRCGERAGRHRARARARRRRQFLVRREPGPPRARQARHRHREDHDLPDAGGHVAAGRRGDDGRGRQRQDLGVHARRRRALRSGGREVHRIQIAHSRQKRKGSGQTYGAAGDRDGNGWWAQMAMDTIVKGDVATGKATEIKLPAVKVDRISAEDRAFYETVNDLGFNAPLPWSQGPRRMGTDKNADVLWVGNSWGATFAKINTKTLETTIIPFPDPTMQPYHIAVDSKHNVWGNLWTSDRIVRLDPSTNAWTMFDLPVRGTEIRHIALLERGDKLSRGDAGLPLEPDGRHDRAQRGRTRGSQSEGVSFRPREIQRSLPCRLTKGWQALRCSGDRLLG